MNVVLGGGFESPTRGFSVLYSCTNLRRLIKDLTKNITIVTPPLHGGFKMGSFRKRNNY